MHYQCKWASVLRWHPLVDLVPSDRNDLQFWLLIELIDTNYPGSQISVSRLPGWDSYTDNKGNLEQFSMTTDKITEMMIDDIRALIIEIVDERLRDWWQRPAL